MVSALIIDNRHLLRLQLPGLTEIVTRGDTLIVNYSYLVDGQQGGGGTHGRVGSCHRWSILVIC